MSCPDCARARLFSRVNGGSWWRRWFGQCWACFKRRSGRWSVAWRVAVVLGALAGNVLAWRWAGKRWLP